MFLYRVLELFLRVVTFVASPPESSPPSLASLSSLILLVPLEPAAFLLFRLIPPLFLVFFSPKQVGYRDLQAGAEGRLSSICTASKEALASGASIDTGLVDLTVPLVELLVAFWGYRMTESSASGRLRFFDGTEAAVVCSWDKVASSMRFIAEPSAF